MRRGEEHGGDGRGFHAKGDTVLVAWDAGAGRLLVSVNGQQSTPIFPRGVKPGPAAGVALFPVVSGSSTRLRINMGADLASRPWRHPPPAGFLPWARQPASQARDAELQVLKVLRPTTPSSPPPSTTITNRTPAPEAQGR